MWDSRLAHGCPTGLFASSPITRSSLIPDLLWVSSSGPERFEGRVQHIQMLFLARAKQYYVSTSAVKTHGTISPPSPGVDIGGLNGKGELGGGTGSYVDPLFPPNPAPQTMQGEGPQLLLSEAVSRAAKAAGARPLTSPESLSRDLEAPEVQESYRQQVPPS